MGSKQKAEELKAVFEKKLKESGMPLCDVIIYAPSFAIIHVKEILELFKYYGWDEKTNGNVQHYSEILTHLEQM